MTGRHEKNVHLPKERSFGSTSQKDEKLPERPFLRQAHVNGVQQTEKDEVKTNVYFEEAHVNVVNENP